MIDAAHRPAGEGDHHALGQNRQGEVYQLALQLVCAGQVPQQTCIGMGGGWGSIRVRGHVGREKEREKMYKEREEGRKKPQ